MPKDSAILGQAGRQTFLFLQGPLCPFFPALAAELEARGHRTLRINLNFGDWLFWRRRGAINYRGSLARWPRYIAQFVARERVTDLILVGEQRPYHRIAIAAVKGRGGRVHVTDLGYLRPDWITLEPDGMTGESHFPREPDAIRRLARNAPAVSLTPEYAESFSHQARWDVIYHLSAWLMKPLYPLYRSHQIYHPVPDYLGTGLRLLLRKRNHARAERVVSDCFATGRPVWLLPMQMEVDYQLRAYSRYSGMTAVMEEVLQSFAKHAPDRDLMVIKVHPLDPGLKAWGRIVRKLAARFGLEGRVFFIDGGNLDAMLTAVRGVITVNSTVGLTALRAARPVIALGQAVYDVPGLTFQGPLDAFWDEGKVPDQALLDCYIRGMIDTVLIRGAYYSEPGMGVAVRAAADRLAVVTALDIKSRLIGQPSWILPTHAAAGAAD